MNHTYDRSIDWQNPLVELLWVVQKFRVVSVDKVSEGDDIEWP